MPLSDRPQALLTIAAALVVVAVCSDPTTMPAVRSVELRLPHDSLFVGRTISAVAVAIGDSSVVARPGFIWTSSDTNVAVVDAAGTVHGLNPGTVVIRAEFGNQREAFTLRVVAQRTDGGVTFAEGSRSYGRGACAISTAGEVYCRPSPSAADTAPVFTRMPGASGMTFTEVHSTQTTCALATGGTIHCWGGNSHWIFGGRLPQSATTEPVQVNTRGLLFSRMTYNGHSQICGISRADAVVHCWGHNDFYQLMRPPKMSSDSLATPVAGGHAAIDVSTTSFSTCLVDLSGAAWCTGGFGASPTSLGIDASSEIIGVGEPQRVLGGVRFTAISAGEAFQCGLTAEGEAWCWGINTGGRLGIGTSRTPSTPGPQRVAGDLRFASVSVSYPSAACGITTDNDLYCWGAFTPVALSARLGARSMTPYQLMRGVKFRALTRSLDDVCGITLEGTILCW